MIRVRDTHSVFRRLRPLDQRRAAETARAPSDRPCFQPRPAETAPNWATLRAPMAELAHEVLHGPSLAMLRVELAPGQPLTAEAGSMVAMRGDVRMETRINADRTAGIFASLWAFVVALVRKVVGGETFFVNTFSSKRGGTVWIAPTLAGQVEYRLLRGERIMLSRGAYLAHTGPLRTRLVFGGLGALLAREGLFFLEISGEGALWFTSYGGIHTVDVDGSYLVDGGHLVAYEGALSFGVQSGGGGLTGLVASGDGVVCAFHGKGRVYIQARNMETLAGWLEPLLPG